MAAAGGDFQDFSAKKESLAIFLQLGFLIVGFTITTNIRLNWSDGCS